MKRFIFFVLIFLTQITQAQVINVTNTSATGRFLGCSGSSAPVVTVTYVSGSGSTFSNGAIACTNPCGTTTVKVNISNIKWYQGPENQWLHGIFLPANAGYSVTGINLPNGFIAYNGGCTGGCPLGIATGPGFYYDATGQNSCCGNVPANDGIPCNNFGMAALDCNPSFGFEFNMTFCNGLLNGNTETFTLTGTPDGATGCWNDPNINGSNSVSFTINTIACSPVASVPFTAGPVVKTCSGSSVNYYAVLSGGCGNGNSVTWWDAATGGNQIGSGSPFTYDPPGSACPAGTTLYASCCPGGTTTCVSRTPVIISGTCDPAMSMVSASGTNGSCAVLSTINSVVVTNNSGTVTYTLNPGNVSNTTGQFSGLSLSSYTVTATDASGCSTSTVITFIPITLPSISTSFTSILCSGGTSTLTATGSISAGPYQYNLNGGAWQPADTFSNLTAGSYTVGVQDAGGCTATTLVLITAPSPLTISCTNNNIPCFGGVTQIVATAGGGTSPYQYSINGGTYGNTNTFPNISAGSYTISVMDANGCTATTIYVVTQPAILNATLVPPTLSCYASTGILTVNATGGTIPSYQYNINAGGYQTTNQFTVGAGTYTVQVYDGNNCYFTTTIIVTQPPAVTISATQIPILCNGTTTSITINAGGGTPAYQYNLNGGSYGSSNVLTGISAGTYTVGTKDANGCTKTTTLTLTQPTPLIVNATVSSIFCSGGAASITVSASGGIPTYQYNINGGAWQTSTVFSGVTVGSYTVGVKDANGCTKTTLVSLTQPTAISLTLSAGNIICNGGSTTITASASGGNSASYLYSLNNGPQQSSNVFSNVVAGNYTVVVKDANNCTTSSQIVIAQPAAINASLIASYILCNGGTAVITAGGNGGTLPYQYSLNGGTYQSSDLFYGNSAGMYSLTVMDANSCTATTTLNITQPSVLTLSASFTSIACNGSLSTITANASGGTTPVYQYSLNGGALQLSSTFSNLSAGTYTVLVKDGYNCTATTFTTITQPNVLSVSLSATSILCNGGTSVLSANATGGSVPFQYSLNGGTFQSSNTYSNILPGMYTVQVKDVQNCSATSTITISQPTALTASATHSTINCNGGSSLITVNASGGTGTYTYQLNGGAFQTSSVFNTAAGLYTITVKDANNCTATTSINILQPAVLSLTLSAPTILCYGGSVTLTANPVGGTVSYQYSLNGGPNQIANTFPNQTTGSYTVVVTDANGCTSSSAMVLNQPSLLQITNIITTIPTCIPGNDATLTATASGGVLPYQYNLNGGAYQSSSVFNNLGVAIYTVTVKDANGCTKTSTASITNPNSPMITSVGTINPPCNGWSNGSITTTATSSSALTYHLYPGNITNGTGVFNNLVANSYTVQVVDANQCSASSLVLITQPSALLFTTTSAQALSCYNSSNGSIQVNATGGTGMITYQLQPGNQINTNGLFSSLSGGTYTVTAIDANACSASTILTVQVPTQLILNSINTTHEHCYNAGDGSILIHCSGGTGILNYTISPATQTNTTGSFSNLSANTYTILVSDANGCTYSTITTVLNPPAITFLSVTHTDVTCMGNTNGSISVQATGGSGSGYTYFLIPGSQSNSTGFFNNLGMNLYTVTATDPNNCTVSTVVQITTPSPIIFNVDSMMNLGCFGGSDGAIYTTASGGMPPYAYSLQPGNITNTIGDFLNLTATSYTMVVTDANGCSMSLGPLALSQPPSMITNIINLQDVTCYGGQDGTFTIQMIGGTPTYSFNMQPSVGNFTSPGTFTLLTANNYTVTVTDGLGCTVSTVLPIQQGPLLIFDSLIAKSPSCYGDLNGVIHAYVQGGSGALTYQLNGTNSNTTGLYQNLPPGNYQLNVSDTKGCLLDTFILLNQPSPLVLSTLEITPVECEMDGNAVILAHGSGGSAPYTYILLPLIKVNNTGQFTGLNAGVYTLKMKDANGCELDTTIIIYPPSKYMEIVMDKKDIGCFGNGKEGEATANVLNGTPPYTYTWSTVPPQYTPTADSLHWGYYYLEVMDATGCIRHDTVFINPGECCDEVFVPNAFTPNGDGLNDVFRLTTAAGIEIMDFIVFNRWGGKIWLTYDISKGWDGTYQGNPQDSNTYYYMLKYRCIHDGSIHLKKGDVMLVR